MALVSLRLRVGERDGEREVTLTGDLRRSVDVAIPCAPPTVAAFHLPATTVEPVRAGGWTGAVDAGASVNCPLVTACWHGAGTHTECMGHALPGRVGWFSHVPPPPPLMPAILLTVGLASVPPPAGVSASPDGAADRVVTGEALEAAWRAVQHDASVQAIAAALGVHEAVAPPPAASPTAHGEPDASPVALVIRTLPNEPADKRTREATAGAEWGGGGCGHAGVPTTGMCHPGLHHADLSYQRVPPSPDLPAGAWSGTNPPYLHPSAIAWALERRFAHLLVDLPSLDREVSTA
jgi:hypothetical protein